MTDLPAFSLLLPVYHGDSAAYLRRSFHSSVHDQTLRPSEVVLVEDGPVGAELTAQIVRLIETSPVPVVHVRISENAGLAVALTTGLAACTNDVVARMDADDVSLPERFAIQIPLIAAGHDLVGSGMWEFSEDASGTEIAGAERNPPTSAADIARYARFHDPFNHPTVVYTKSAVAAAGGYAPLGLMEDYWLFARMIAGGARARNTTERLVKYRVSSGAYRRRGGLKLLASELQLQRAFRRSGFTSTGQFVRNVAVRGGYRLIPEPVRRYFYRTLILRSRAL
ncbi:glycosyltransferase [Cryobacterium frigoriphilum]|uniref:Glycosyltransferase n=1 Tax=Cryobacterium frigoriphilum TaxID=1259150 RepID=A0A4R9A2A8_9MICO|nr:glycosyltransferase [Cryobacterium frigoriphilum]TFD50792.1 glycosyltransferase [Cryobacterium frigoriphilum]